MNIKSINFRNSCAGYTDISKRQNRNLIYKSMRTTHFAICSVFYPMEVSCIVEALGNFISKALFKISFLSNLNITPLCDRPYSENATAYWFSRPSIKLTFPNFQIKYCIHPVRAKSFQRLSINCIIYTFPYTCGL